MLESDNTMTQEAVKYLLKGQGTYEADGFSAEMGFATVTVKPFGREMVDVWFYKADDPCNCKSHHVEFGRTGGEMLILQKNEG